MNHYLVTGCFGFIGQYLCEALVRSGGFVKGIGHRPKTMYSNIDEASCKLYDADLNFASLESLLYSEHGYPETIFHLAGGASVGAAIENPRRDFERTVTPTLDLLEWMRLKCPNSQLVVISSAAVYGAQYRIPISEDAVVNPYSPYGFNKYIMETLCKSYAENYGLTVKVVRLFSVYGEQLKKQLLWDFCMKLHRSNEAIIELGGTGEEVRDWIHVTDVVRSILQLSEQIVAPGALVNIASGVSSTVKEVAQIVLSAWYRDYPHPVIVYSGKARKGDPFSLTADVSLMNSLVNSTCKDLATGISEYVSWFKTQVENI